MYSMEDGIFKYRKAGIDDLRTFFMKQSERLSEHELRIESSYQSHLQGGAHHANVDVG